jgi:hypothetical protein
LLLIPVRSRFHEIESGRAQPHCYEYCQALRVRCLSFLS